MRISTIRDLITHIKECPDICGLELVCLDNVFCQGVTSLRAVIYTDGPYIVIEHHADKQSEDAVTVQVLYDGLVNQKQHRRGVFLDSLFFVGTDAVRPNVKCVDGVVYLNYIEANDIHQLTL
jgi:hypothetical protein